MITREEIDKLRKSADIDGQPIGLLAKSSEDKSILCVNIFAFDPKTELTIADLVVCLSQYLSSVVEGKLLHGLSVKWHPGEKNGSPPGEAAKNPTGPNERARPVYLGDDL